MSERNAELEAKWRGERCAGCADFARFPTRETMCRDTTKIIWDEEGSSVGPLSYKPGMGIPVLPSHGCDNWKPRTSVKTNTNTEKEN